MHTKNNLLAYLFIADFQVFLIWNVSLSWQTLQSLPDSMKKASEFLARRIHSLTNPYAVALTTNALANEGQHQLDILNRFSSSSELVRPHHGAAQPMMHTASSTRDTLTDDTLSTHDSWQNSPLHTLYSFIFKMSEWIFWHSQSPIAPLCKWWNISMVKHNCKCSQQHI